MIGKLRPQPFLLLLVFSVLGASALAQPAAPSWQTDPNTGCKIAGPPALSVSWSGGCVAGLAQGTGTARWSGPNDRAEQYDGEMRAGRRNGRGVFIWISGSPYVGDRYEGDFVDNRFHGQGVYEWKSGNRYEGEWRNNDFNGQGVMRWANGDVYSGQWQNDRAHGQGTKTSRDGRVYSGSWNNGCFRQGDRWSTAGATGKECGFQ